MLSERRYCLGIPPFFFKTYVPRFLPFRREDARPSATSSLPSESASLMVIDDADSRGYPSCCALRSPPSPARGEAFRRKPKEAKDAATPPEVKLSEGSRRKRRTPFLREEAEGLPSFGRKPKDVLFSKQVGFLRKAARGEAFRRKPKDALPSGGRAFFKTSSESRRTRFFQNKFASFGKRVTVKLILPPSVSERVDSYGRTRSAAL